MTQIHFLYGLIIRYQRL